MGAPADPQPLSRAEPREQERAWLWRAAPYALATTLVAIYAPALGAGWLDYDDDWLVRDNAILSAHSLSSFVTIVSDFGRAARLALGAEYLPIRDLAVWIETWIFGVSPLASHAINLAIYVAACLAMRAWLHRSIDERKVAELAVWIFALHPVHAESVAWIAGRKDVLSLLFVSAALTIHARDDARARRALVPILALLAGLSKASAVVLPLLLVLQDRLARRPHDRVELAIVTAIAGALVALHVYVGGVVSMLAPLPGGSRLGALATMGPVFLRYLGISFGVSPGSIEHDVPDRAWSDPVAIGAWAGLLVLAVAIAGIARRERVAGFAGAVFVVALLPVSQVVAPLQNRMADRYLLLAVLGPALLLALFAARLRNVVRPGVSSLVAIALLLVFGALGAMRVRTWSDPIALWVEAAEIAPESTVPPYQLAKALEVRGELEGAEASYRETIRRDGESASENGRRAMNNLAILLARQRRLPEAIALLESAVSRYPHDPRVRANLATLLEAIGQAARAAELRAEIARRFPDYRPESASRQEPVGTPDQVR